MTDRQRMFDYLDGVADGLNESRNDVADVLEQISAEVNKLKKVSDGNKVYVGINDVLDIIDKYKE